LAPQLGDQNLISNKVYHVDTSQNGKIERIAIKLFSERFDASLAQKWRKTAVARIFGDFSAIFWIFRRSKSGLSTNH
jgi:hypothetical protein